VRLVFCVRTGRSNFIQGGLPPFVGGGPAVDPQLTHRHREHSEDHRQDAPPHTKMEFEDGAGSTADHEPKGARERGAGPASGLGKIVGLSPPHDDHRQVDGELRVFVAMVASLTDYHQLLSIHRPLGIAVLILVVVRFANRKMPPFPSTMSHIERQVAKMSEYLMYALTLVLPLVGWGMLSAAHYPIVLFGSVYLPWILPRNLKLHWELRQTHTVLAYLF
jgi:hypothetical protein